MFPLLELYAYRDAPSFDMPDNSLFESPGFDHIERFMLLPWRGPHCAHRFGRAPRQQEARLPLTTRAYLQ